jgi:hypothetical protein
MLEVNQALNRKSINPSVLLQYTIGWLKIDQRFQSISKYLQQLSTYDFYQGITFSFKNSDCKDANTCSSLKISKPYPKHEDNRPFSLKTPQVSLNPVPHSTPEQVSNGTSDS